MSKEKTKAKQKKVSAKVETLGRCRFALYLRLSYILFNLFQVTKNRNLTKLLVCIQRVR